jgi:hypothetical protein
MARSVRVIALLAILAPAPLLAVHSPAATSDPGSTAVDPSPRTAHAGPAGDAAPGSRSPAGERCLVCGSPVDADGLALIHRGRRVPLHREACLDHWEAHSAELFASLRPRGALFQEPAEPASPLRGAWFLFGCYVLLGLVCGAAAGYLALHRGLPPVRWFFAGLALNVLSLAVLLTRSRRDLSRLPAGVPPGLVKVPLTHPPASCPGCGAGNHPAARACSSCGAVLSSHVQPETDRA